MTCEALAAALEDVDARMTSVSVTQPYVPAYRLPLFERVHQILRSQSVDFRVFHRDPRRFGAPRDASEAVWSQVVPGWGRAVPGGRASYRVLPREWSRPDLLVTELGAGNLNAWAAAGSRRPFVLFGHGQSGTTGASRFGQALENRLIPLATHVITYMPDGAAAVARATGTPRERVTPFMNSTDSRALRALRDQVSPAAVAAFASAHRLTVSAPTILSLGRMNALKRLDLLISTVLELRRRLPGLQVIIGGRGPSEDLVRDLAQREPGIVWLGRISEDDLAIASQLSYVLLNPGSVGLVAVDALALNLAVVTAEGSAHGPEIAYLRPGVELFEAAAGPTAVAEAVIAALDAGRPAPRTADLPTIERAADTFARCLLTVLGR